MSNTRRPYTENPATATTTTTLPDERTSQSSSDTESDDNDNGSTLYTGGGPANGFMSDDDIYVDDGLTASEGKQRADDSDEEDSTEKENDSSPTPQSWSTWAYDNAGAAYNATAATAATATAAVTTAAGTLATHVTTGTSAAAGAIGQAATWVGDNVAAASARTAEANKKTNAIAEAACETLYEQSRATRKTLGDLHDYVDRVQTDGVNALDVISVEKRHEAIDAMAKALIQLKDIECSGSSAANGNSTLQKLEDGLSNVFSNPVFGPLLLSYIDQLTTLIANDVRSNQLVEDFIQQGFHPVKQAQRGVGAASKVAATTVGNKLVSITTAGLSDAIKKRPIIAMLAVSTGTGYVVLPLYGVIVSLIRLLHQPKKLKLFVKKVAADAVTTLQENQKLKENMDFVNGKVEEAIRQIKEAMLNIDNQLSSLGVNISKAVAKKALKLRKEKPTERDVRVCADVVATIGGAAATIWMSDELQRHIAGLRYEYNRLKELLEKFEALIDRFKDHHQDTLTNSVSLTYDAVVEDSLHLFQQICKGLDIKIPAGDHLSSLLKGKLPEHELIKIWDEFNRLDEAMGKAFKVALDAGMSQAASIAGANAAANCVQQVVGGAAAQAATWAVANGAQAVANQAAVTAQREVRNYYLAQQAAHYQAACAIEGGDNPYIIMLIEQFKKSYPLVHKLLDKAGIYLADKTYAALKKRAGHETQAVSLGGASRATLFVDNRSMLTRGQDAMREMINNMLESIAQLAVRMQPSETTQTMIKALLVMTFFVAYVSYQWSSFMEEEKVKRMSGGSPGM